MKHVPRILAHAVIVLVLVLATLLIFDYFNPSMDFINNAMTKVMIGVLCIISIINAGFVLIAIRRK
ncbi:MAG: hypothetical protein IJO75_02945 [Clostridia bacterium]|nr:hypothetical protein [Clostridia bacterium]